MLNLRVGTAPFRAGSRAPAARAIVARPVVAPTSSMVMSGMAVGMREDGKPERMVSPRRSLVLELAMARRIISASTHHQRSLKGASAMHMHA